MSVIAISAIIAPLLLALLSYPLGRWAIPARNILVLSALALNLFLALGLLATAISAGSFSFTWFTLAVAAITLPVGLVVNPLSAGLMLALAIVLLLVGFYSYQASRPRQHCLYFALLLLATSGLNGFVLSRDLTSLYLFWEVVTLAFTFLIMTDLEPKATLAGLKAFATNEIAGLGLFFAILLTLANFRITDISQVAVWLAEDSTGTHGWIIALFLAATAVRAGLVPLHTWLVTAMGHSRFPVGALLLAALNISGLYALLRLLTPTLLANQSLAHVVGLLGAISVLIGGYAALRQPDVRMMLGYFGIAQCGFVVLSLGMGTGLGTIAAVAQIIAITLTLPLMLLALAMLRPTPDPARTNDEPVGDGSLPAMALWIGSLGAIGLPPLIGFGARWLLFQAGLVNIDWWSGAFLATALLGTILGVRLGIQLILPAAGELAGEVPHRGRPQPATSALLALAAIVVLVPLPGTLFLQYAVYPLTRLLTQSPVSEPPTGWPGIASFFLVLAALAIGVFIYRPRPDAFSPTEEHRSTMGRFAPLQQRTAPLIDSCRRWSDQGRFDLYGIISGPLVVVSRLVSGIFLVVTRRMGGW